MKARKYKYKQNDRPLEEKFIRGINIDAMITEIIQELTSINNTSEVTSEQVPMWAKRVEAQMLQTVM